MFKLFPTKNVLVFLVLLFIGGCQSIKDLANSIQKPTLSINDVRIESFDFQEMQLVYDVKVNNPNAASLKMLGYDYSLDINGNSFLQGEQTTGIDIKASDASIIEVPVAVNFQELFRTVKGVAQQDESSYSFLSTLVFELPVLGQTEIPVSKKGNIPVIKLPKLSIESLKVEDISLSSADLNLKLQFDNPNGFGLNINELTYDFEVDGNNWASGKTLQGIRVKNNGTTELDIPISLNIAQLGISAYRMLQGSNTPDYKLEGNFSFDALHELLGTTNFSFERSGQIRISR